MELNAKTKIDVLLKQHPFLLDFLITLSPHFKNLKNPLIRKTMGKVATLKQAADIGGQDVEDMISVLTAEIKKHGGSVEASGDSAVPPRDEALADPKERQAVLKGTYK